MSFIKNISDSFTLERIILLTLGGTLIHWYDFYIVSTLLNEILGQVVKAGSEEFTLLLLVFSFIGFAIRPIGAILFCHLIDKKGRRKSFSNSLVIITLSTMICILLPIQTNHTYIVIGLLIIIRLLQGIALSVEYASALIYVSENVPRERAGFYTSLVQTSAPLGFALSLFIFLSTKYLFGEEFIHSGGWRFPLFFSIPLIFITLSIRNKLPESPVFSMMQKTGELSLSPIREAFTTKINLKKIFVSLFAVCVPQGIMYYFAHVFLSSYLIDNYFINSKESVFLLLLFASLITWPFNIISGHLSDIYGTHKILLASLIFSLIFICFLFFSFLTISSQLSLISALLIFIFTFICSHFIYGSTGAYLTEKFPAKIAATSLSVPYHVGNGLFGGAFFLTNYFYPAKNFNFMPALCYVVIFLSIGIVLLFISDSSQESK